MSYDFEALMHRCPLRPRAIYDAWLDSAAHSAMTGAPARIGRSVGDAFTAWDGYITARFWTSFPAGASCSRGGRREFADDDPDSSVIVDLEPTSAGTRLTLTHSGVPDGQTAYENGGWRDFYFAPMEAYFADGKRPEGAKPGTDA